MRYSAHRRPRVKARSENLAAVIFLAYSAAPPALGLVCGQHNAAGVFVVSAVVVALSAAPVAGLRLPRRAFP